MGTLNMNTGELMVFSRRQQKTGIAIDSFMYLFALNWDQGFSGPVFLSSL